MLVEGLEIKHGFEQILEGMDSTVWRVLLLLSINCNLLNVVCLRKDFCCKIAQSSWGFLAKAPSLRAIEMYNLHLTFRLLDHKDTRKLSTFLNNKKLGDWWESDVIVNSVSSKRCKLVNSPHVKAWCFIQIFLYTMNEVINNPIGVRDGRMCNFIWKSWFKTL